MTPDDILFAATIAAPIFILVVCVFAANRALLPFASLPALATALFVPEGTMLRLPGWLLRLTFELDEPGALLLGGAALLWTAASVYAWAYGDRGNERRFTIWWLATMTGSFGVFIVADIVGFYLFFTLVSLSAYWIVVRDATAPVRRAGAVYVLFALLSEAFLLAAFVSLAIGAPEGDLLIRDAVAALVASPMRDPTLAFLILGFGMKIGLVPMHVWMPLTYSAASIPVASVLSGAAVKAGVIGLIRFLPFESALPQWGDFLVVLGFISAFYGVVIGLTQNNPRTVLAYSSISQMGVISAVFGMGLAAGDPNVQILGAFYGLHHILVKGGLFLALGAGRRRKTVLIFVPAAIVALGLGGLPLTGGALAKLAVKDILGDGLAGLCGTLSTIGSAVLMLHFVRRLAAETGADARRGLPSAALISWLAIAGCAIAAPWTLYAFATDKPLLDAFSPSVVWSSAWPVLAGLFLGAVLERWRSVIPFVPPGDILAGGEAIMRSATTVSVSIAELDRRLSLWPVAGTLFLFITTALAAAMLMTR